MLPLIPASDIPWIELSDPGLCVFCGAHSRLTKEHVLPDSWRRYFPDWTNGGTYRRVGDRGFVDRESKGSLFDAWSKRFCADCNGGWMRLIDEAAKPVLEPLIFGSSRRISAADGPTITRWATKTSIVRALADNDRSYEPSQMLLRHFYENRAPVFHAAVQVATGVGPGGTFMSVDRTSSTTAGSVHIVTIVIGAFAVQCALAPVGDDELQESEREEARRLLLTSRVITRKKFQSVLSSDLELGEALTPDQLALAQETTQVRRGWPLVGVSGKASPVGPTSRRGSMFS
jgi:hypothetical protein